MHEQKLREFFIGRASAADLAKDVAGSHVAVSPIMSRTRIVDMDSEFQVTRPMLIALCDAVLAGEFPPQDLEIIGFALMCSDKFTWDGDVDEVLAEVIADWSCPIINYPLTLQSVERCRRWLLGTEPYPTRPRMSHHG